MCKDTIKTPDTFIRAIDVATEPMCVLATNQQLLDMERFCCGQGNNVSVLSVDPKFNLGSFYVTPATYQNLMIENDKGTHPLHAVPILVHHTKTLKPFHYFSSTLISYNPSLVNLRAFGTDGEPELAKAFKLSFPNAVHLRCTNHFRQNVKDKLSSIGISQSIWKEYLYDIFGCQLGSHYQKGLIDSASTSCFLDSLQKSKAKWNNLESSCFGHGHCPHFFDWFVKYKSEIWQCACCLMLKPKQVFMESVKCLQPTTASHSIM